MGSDGRRSRCGLLFRPPARLALSGEELGYVSLPPYRAHCQPVYRLREVQVAGELRGPLPGNAREAGYLSQPRELGKAGHGQAAQ